MDQSSGNGPDSCSPGDPAHERGVGGSVHAAGGAGRAHDPADVLSRQQLSWLMSTIEDDVVPRLVGAHRRADQHVALRDPDARAAPAGAAGRLVELVLRERTAEALAWLQTLVDSGTPVHSVYLGILAPAARLLGVLWEQDRADFAQVTIALWRLQELMYDMHAAFLDAAVPALPARRILLAPSQGSQHTFGMLMVAEFFRRAGWSVWSDPSATRRDVIRALRDDWFDVVGLSVGVTDHLASLAGTVRAVRRASRNDRLAILLGGPAMLNHPEYVALAGADAMALDAAEAVAAAQRLVPGAQPGIAAAN